MAEEKKLKINIDGPIKTSVLTPEEVNAILLRREKNFEKLIESVHNISIGEPIEELNSKVSSVENTMDLLNASVAELDSGPQVGLIPEIQKQLNFLGEEVSAIKNETIPRLVRADSALSKSNEFFQETLSFSTTVIEGEAIIKTLLQLFDSKEHILYFLIHLNLKLIYGFYF